MLKRYKNTEQGQGTLCVSAFERKMAWRAQELFCVFVKK